MINAVAIKFNKLIHGGISRHATQVPPPALTRKPIMDFELSGRNMPPIINLGKNPQNVIKAEYYAKQFSPAALKEIKQAGYEIYVVKDFRDILRVRGMHPYTFDSKTLLFDGICYDDGVHRFIGIREELNKTVFSATMNHEASHAFNNIKGFYNIPEVHHAFLQDMSALGNASVWKTFNRSEKDTLEIFFLREKKDVAFGEAIADLIATKFLDGGVYNKKCDGRENLIELAFPKLNVALDKFVMPIIS